MSYKPAEHELMAYLYGELEGADKTRIDEYFLANPAAREEMEKLGGVSTLLGTIKDKEVIAPPIFLGDTRPAGLWDTPYFRTIVSIAASLLILIVAAWLTDVRVSAGGNEFRLSFGETKAVLPAQEDRPSSLTAAEVQSMINESLQANNGVLNANWEDSQRKLASSITTNLRSNSGRMDDLVRQASVASKEQVEKYIAGLQAENLKMVKDYFALTSGEQKQYIEELLVDFARYLQQQRQDDLNLVQMRLNTLEKKSTVFQQETEQILTSIISNVNSPVQTETKY